MTKIRMEFASDRQADRAELVLQKRRVQYKREGKTVEFLERDADRDTMYHLQKVRLMRESESKLKERLIDVLEGQKTD